MCEHLYTFYFSLFTELCLLKIVLDSLLCRLREMPDSSQCLITVWITLGTLRNKDTVIQWAQSWPPQKEAWMQNYIWTSREGGFDLTPLLVEIHDLIVSKSNALYFSS